ncbi:hypothetical protein D3C84_1055410 [compost metagenome]
MAGQGSYQETVGLIRPVAHQDAVETGLLMGLGKTGDVRLVEDRPLRGMDFRGQSMADHTDELNAHAENLVRGRMAMRFESK